MRVRVISEGDATSNLRASVDELVDTEPDLSARQTMPRRQKLFLLAVVAAFGVACLLDLTDSVIFLLSLIAALYIAITVNRAVLFYFSSRPATVLSISDDEALLYPDDALPVYSVLVPAYREPEVITQLIANLDRLEYPRAKLDIKIILEADDDDTLAAVLDVNPGDHFEVVVVPPAGPRTKPKALNYALHAARGDLVTIYDAEDDPEPLQLRRAAIALAQGGPKMACVQAKLSFANVEQNLLTRWFTLEYDMWFSMLLPGLVYLGAPLPLGGTSNHFRRDLLEELGGWDPFNVTEDADLGVRLARRGYFCGVLDSTTFEEANSDFINWVKQRSRWYKGYLQTALIHLRHPVTLRRELGWQGFLQVILFVLGTPLLALINPAFWFLTLLWFVASPHWIKSLFPGGLYYPSVACWVFGNILVAYLTVLTCRLSKRPELIVASLLVPIYWVMMALAAIKASWQLVASPNFWEKTVHGLTHHDDGPPQTDGNTVLTPSVALDLSDQRPVVDLSDQSIPSV